jgi:hypothetical protein
MTTPSSPQGSIAGSVLPIRRAEELIATLPGVVAVRIVPSDLGAIEEVHVLTTDQIAPKNTVRNIESALIAQLGLRVNHRKISVATTIEAMRPDEPPAAPASTLGALGASAGGVSPSAPIAGGSAASAASAPTGFVPNRGVSQAETSHSMAPSVLASTARRLLVFEDVEVRRSRARGVLCRVTLMRDGTEYVGESEGQESERSRVELSARATLQAIATATTATPGGEKSIALEGAKLIDAFDRAFVFVSLSARVGREPVVLTGSCEVRESAETSAVLAVLDATNRWVHFDR